MIKNKGKFDVLMQKLEDDLHTRDLKLSEHIGLVDESINQIKKQMARATEMEGQLRQLHDTCAS